MQIIYCLLPAETTFAGYHITSYTAEVMSITKYPEVAHLVFPCTAPIHIEGSALVLTGYRTYY